MSVTRWMVTLTMGYASSAQWPCQRARVTPMGKAKPRLQAAHGALCERQFLHEAERLADAALERVRRDEQAPQLAGDDDSLSTTTRR
jgi:hypothetical protein